MTIDIITLILVILLFVRGYKKGIIIAICSVLAIVLGLSCALSLSARLSVYLLDKGYVSSGLAPIISYVVLFIGVVWLVRLLAKVLDGFANTILLGWANKSVGGLLYVLAGLVAYSVLLWLCNYAHLIPPETTVNSRTYRYIEPFAPWIFERMTGILPFTKNTFADMRAFFSDINHQLPEHVGTPR